MNYQWRSRESGWTTCNETSSANSPLPVHPSIQDAIRPGTVASRIRFLQGLANQVPSRPHPPPIRIRRGEESLRTGFGRRLTNRFGKPALHNTNPDEEPQVEIALHSFLGLNTPRMNHGEQHAFANYRTRYARSPGINGQIIPDGMMVRTQHDAVAPWGVLSRRNRSRSMGRQVTDSEVDVLHEINCSRNHGRFIAGSSSLRNVSDDSKYVDLFHRSVKSRPADTMRSEGSNATSSTTRRQSVRDLFKDYGIERPAGLASREPSYNTRNTPRLAKSPRQCHVCSRVNTGISILCSRCNHRLCAQCSALSPLPESRDREGLVNQSKDNSGDKLVSKENWSVDQEPNQRHLKSVPITGQPRKDMPLSTWKIPKPPGKPPDLPHVESATAQKRSSEIPRQDRPFLEAPLPISFLPGSQVPTRVRDSPFLIADSLTSSRPRPTFPIAALVSNNLCSRNLQDSNGPRHRGAPGHPLQQLEHQDATSSSSDGDCKSPTCRATHCGHQPYRHAVSCIKKKRHHTHKHTDNGYSADTSQVEDALYLQSSSFAHDTTQLAHPPSNPAIPDAQVSRSRAVVTKSCMQEVPEFVECHGYPRTGHSRLGSPVSSGVVGECQHCLHDCHCAACQSTYHSVRCCVHVDHEAKIHQHFTPRREISVSENEPTVASLGVPNISSQPGASKNGDAISPSSEQKAISVTKISSRGSARQNQPFQKPTLVKMSSLPRSKTSSLMAGIIAQPPTPPPWVSSPRRGSKSGIATIERWQKTRREDVDTASEIERLPDPPPPFKERPIFPAPAPYNESRHQDSRRRSHETWTTLRSGHEPDHNGNQVASYRQRSQKSIVEKHSRPPSRMQVSPPGSRRASRRLSALFQLREKNTVPLLNQKLLEHQEELKRAQKECDDPTENTVRRSLDAFAWNNECKDFLGSVRPEGTERAEGADSTKIDPVRKKKWRLILVDRAPSPACVNDLTVGQHRLADDESVSDAKMPHAAGHEKLTGVPPPDSGGRDCVWKLKLMKKSGRGLDIQGVTVLVHSEGREDVILKTADWKGGKE